MTTIVNWYQDLLSLGNKDDFLKYQQVCEFIDNKCGTNEWFNILGPIFNRHIVYKRQLNAQMHFQDVVFSQNISCPDICLKIDSSFLSWFSYSHNKR
jgi:hypothetical protein